LKANPNSIRLKGIPAPVEKKIASRDFSPKSPAEDAFQMHHVHVTSGNELCVRVTILHEQIEACGQARPKGQNMTQGSPSEIFLVAEDKLGMIVWISWD